MSIAVHAITLDVFVASLGNLAKILDKATAFAEAKKLDAGVIENLRLAPDMLSFTKQIQLACDFAKNSTARLAGIEAPKFEDNETKLAQLQARVAATLEWLGTVRPEQLDGGETRKITLPLRTRTLELDGLTFIRKWALPNFFFHVTTAYALLREAGVEIGKQDYLGGI
jgi:hypothetical protein